MSDGFDDDDDELLLQHCIAQDDKINKSYSNTSSATISSEGNSEPGFFAGKKEGISAETSAVKAKPKTFTEAFGFLTDSMAKQEEKDVFMKKASSAAPWMNQAQHIVVHPCQKGNPLLNSLTNVSWKYSDSTAPPPADYIMTPSSCALFLSLRYHALKPEYIYKRLKHLHSYKTFTIKVLLCLVDVKEPTKAVVELTKACFVVDVTLLLAFSNGEAATYVETFKSYEKKPADSIKTKQSTSHVSKASEVLSSIPSINTTDAHTLLTEFETLVNLSKVSEENLALCPGIGGIKANNITKLFNQPFLKHSDRKKAAVVKSEESKTSEPQANVTEKS